MDEYLKYHVNLMEALWNTEEMYEFTAEQLVTMCKEYCRLYNVGAMMNTEKWVKDYAKRLQG